MLLPAELLTCIGSVLGPLLQLVRLVAQQMRCVRLSPRVDWTGSFREAHSSLNHPPLHVPDGVGGLQATISFNPQLPLSSTGGEESCGAGLEKWKKK